LAYALTQDIDYVAISFVQKPEDVIEVREFITQRTDKPIKIISKIERPQALARIDDIIKNSDGIMVARGDLAVEVPFYKVPEITRNLIRKCRYMNKPIIVATQMLASMIENEFPTRAEISDVANAAYLRADSTMTSEETTIGINPPHVIDTMAKILENADEDEVHNHYNGGIKSYHDNAWSKSVVDLAELNSAVAIVVFTHGGTNARTISSRCPDLPIVAVCGDKIIADQLCLHRGIFPVLDAKLLNDQDYATAVAKIGINNGPVVIICDDKITLGRV
jgi:pyruvate kinase